MRRRGFTIWQAVVILALVAIAVMVVYPVFERVKWNSKHYSCQSNLKQVALGIQQYIQDWDEYYPITDVKDSNIDEKNPLGWADALYPYTKSRQIFWCPNRIKDGQRDETEKVPSDRDYTDFFFNRRLAGIETKRVKSQSLTILLGEGNDGTDAANARYSLSTLPAAWIKDESSPLHRHLGGSNYAFADGHVKWMKPQKISAKLTDQDSDGNTYTFAVK